MVSFDAYLNWLGIPPHEQPPNFYRLLGLVLFESNPEVIQQAADRQSLHVGSFQAGPQGEMCQQLMNEIAMARFCLLDPQQKAAYDGQLYGSLAQRGECSVAAPPPPAWTGGGQFGPQSPQFGPQAGMGPSQPGQTAQGPMAMPGFLPPRPGVPGAPAPMPGVAAMPGPAMMSPQPVMEMPPTMMSAPPGFRAPGGAPSTLGPGQAMPRPVAPAAAPFPVPTSRPVAASPAAPRSAAPPANPPAAPQTPIDELESLAAQPTTRHRPLRKKQSTDYTKQIIMGSVVAAAGVLLFIVWAAVRSNDDTPARFRQSCRAGKASGCDAAKICQGTQAEGEEDRKGKRNRTGKGEAGRR